jgi:hypothetical protein
MPVNSSNLTYLKAALFFCYFLLKGVSINELTGITMFTDFSIGTYLLAVGLSLFSILTLLQKDTRIPAQFFYLFGVIFLMTLSFWLNGFLATGTSALSFYLENVLSLLLILLIFLTFQTTQEIEFFLKALIYSSLLISIYWIVQAIQNPASLYRVGNILGEGASYNTTSFHLVAAAWVGPMVNLVDSRRSFKFKIFQDTPFLAILTFANFLTGSKGGVAAEICLFLILLFFNFDEKNKKTVLQFYWKFTLIVIAPVAVGVYFIKSLDGNLLAINRIILGILNPDDYSGRLELWAFAIDQMLVDLPGLITGKGFGAFNILQGGMIATYPHNFILALAFNAGIPAALLFSFWLIKTWVFNFRLVRTKGLDPDMKTLILKVIGWGFVAVFFGFISGKFSAQTMVWFFLALSLRLRQHIRGIEAANGERMRRSDFQVTLH